MFSRLLIVVVAGGVALAGVILFTNLNTSKTDLGEMANLNYSVEQTGVISPTLASQKIFKPQNPPVHKLTVSPLPETILSNTPTPSPLTSLSPSTIPVISIAVTAAPLSTTPLASVTPSSQPQAQHIFYTSSHWKAKYYYCDTDPDWKTLSSTYLKSFTSPEELLKSYNRISHEPCK